MKSYAKLVEAVQYQGDIEIIAEFLNEDGELTGIDNKVILITSTDKWNLVKGDYVVRDFRGIAVYKAFRFEAEFEEVHYEEDLNTEKLENALSPVISNGDLLSKNQKPFEDYIKGIEDTITPSEKKVDIESQKSISLEDLEASKKQSESKDIASTKPVKKAAEKKE